MLTLEQLLVLKAVVETGSFRAASETLHKAQSAVSYAIKNLESDLDVQIFDRSSYRPVLTEQGKAIFNKSKMVLSQVEDLSQLGEHLAQGRESEVRLAVNGICHFDNVIKVIHRFSKNNPAVRVLLSVENLGGSIEQLLLGNVDIALAEVTDMPDQMEGVLWDKIEFVTVSAPDYPPALSKSKLTKSDMLQYVQIVVADSSRRFQPKTAGVLKEATHWTVNDFSIKRQLIKAGLGWGNMPRHLVEEDIKDGKLVTISYSTTINLIVDFYLLKRKDALLGPMCTELWNLFSDTKASF